MKTKELFKLATENGKYTLDISQHADWHPEYVDRDEIALSYRVDGLDYVLTIPFYDENGQETMVFGDEDGRTYVLDNGGDKVEVTLYKKVKII